MAKIQLIVESKNADTVRGTFIDEGKIALLEAINKYGSMSGAARSLNITYKHVHKVITQMNDEAAHTLVVSTVGGDDGGGTFITDYAKSLVLDYRTLEETIKKGVDDTLLEKYQR